MQTHLTSDQKLGPFPQNIGTMLFENGQRYSGTPAFGERMKDSYHYWSWEQLYTDVVGFACYVKSEGFLPGDKIALITSNSYYRLICELAVMSSGMVAVPIFPGYPSELMGQLIAFGDCKLLIVEGQEKIATLGNFGGKYLPEKIIEIRQVPVLLKADFSAMEMEMLKTWQGVSAQDCCLIMFTSGTTNFPKGVMLSHRNILSQQKSTEQLWKLNSGLRFLCYLPWHHSFGGLFERFLVLSSGGMLAIDDSCGRDVNRLLENWALIKPHVYFSVPRIYQEIAASVLSSSETARKFFHPELKFVFTAAAPLPLSTSNIFKENNIPVVEGWGLTETSPCCTLTAQSLDRTPGIVGRPIPEVQVKLADEQEICVKGPNVMSGYYKMPEITSKVIDAEGWFHTGDVGEITPEGLRIISRLDRIFKLSNAEKVFPVVMEEKATKRCNYIKYIYVFGSGGPAPMALVFPNLLLLQSDNVNIVECVRPQSCAKLSDCLKKCICEINEYHEVKYERLSKALVINRELSIEKEELTPSMKLVPRMIERNFKKYIDFLKGESGKTPPADSYLIELTERSTYDTHK